MATSKYIRLNPKNSELTACPENSDEGCKLVLGNWRENDKNLLWYHEPSSSTIRCLKTDKCITVSNDGNVTLTTYSPSRNEEQALNFKHEEGIIEVKNQPGKVLTCSEKTLKSFVCVKDHDPENLWEFTHVLIEADLFYLKATNGLVLGTEAESREPGTRLVLTKQRENRPYDQLWYEASDKTLRCAHNHFVLSHNEGDVTLEYPRDDNSHVWRYYEPTVYCQHGNDRKYLTIVELKEGSPVRKGDNNGSEMERFTKEICE